MSDIRNDRAPEKQLREKKKRRKLSKLKSPALILLEIKVLFDYFLLFFFLYKLTVSGSQWDDSNGIPVQMFYGEINKNTFAHSSSKNSIQVKISLISSQKHMFWVLIRSI